MIVEIQNIETETLELVVAALDEINLCDLAGVFMRWAFGVEWREVEDLSPDNERLVTKIMDAACVSYSYRFDDREFTKRKVDEENKPACFDVRSEETKEKDPEPEFSSDEDALDLQTPEENEHARSKQVTALHEESAACAQKMIKVEALRNAKGSHSKSTRKQMAEQVTATVRIMTDQRQDVAGLLREYKMPELAKLVESDLNAERKVPRPAGEQFKQLQEILDAMCQSYTVQIGSWRRVSA